MNYLEKRLKEIDDIPAYSVNGRKEKFTQQLLEQGFHDGDTFDLHIHLTDLILPRLKRYKELAKDVIAIDFPLDDMIKAFELIQEDKFSWNEEEQKIYNKGMDAFAKYFTALWW